MKLSVFTLVLSTAGAASAIRGSATKEDRYLQEQASFMWTQGLGSSVIVGGTFEKNNPTSATSAPKTCTFKPNSFTSDIIVEFDGNPDQVTARGITTLEKQIKLAYAGASAPLCDQKFRDIYNVSIVEQKPLAGDARRNLLATGSPPVVLTRFSYRFFVTGVCRACKKDSQLFNDGVRRRMQEEKYKYDFEGNYRRHLEFFTRGDLVYSGTNIGGTTIIRPQDRPDIFFAITNPPAVTLTSPRSCDCQNAFGINKAPSEKSFTATLNTNLQATLVEGISRVLAVTEVKEIKCATGLNKFNSTVLIDSIGAPDAVTQSELEVLGSTFVTSYNRLAYETCDPKFRAAQIAVFAIEPSYSFSGGKTGRQLQRRHYPFRFRVAITGVCKSCEQDSALFDDALRRFLGASEEIEVPAFMVPHRQLGYVVGTDICYCAVNAPPRTPGTVAFTNLFNSTVNEQIAAGNIKNVNLISSTIQVNENKPSTSPSASPTTSLAPSNAPSVRPTTQTPSRSPSVSPTELPTQTPTVSPTPYPTDSPTMSPTPYPTMVPSSRPTTSSPTPMPFPTESPRPSPSPSLMPSNS